MAGPGQQPANPGEEGRALTRKSAKTSQRRCHLSWEKRGGACHVEGTVEPEAQRYETVKPEDWFSLVDSRLRV